MSKKTAVGVCVLGASLTLFFLGPKTRAAAPSSWTAVLSAAGNLTADPARESSGYIYDNAEPSVDVYATIGTINSGTLRYRTIFRLNVYPPAKVFLNGIVPRAYFADPSLIACAFPDPGRPCLFDFLNGPHPLDDRYASVQIAFFGPYTTREDADWEAWPIGVPKPMRLWISVNAKNLTGDCSECSPEGCHSFEINSYDAVLIRQSVNEWTASVNATFDNPEIPVPSGPSFDLNYSTHEFIAEKYCECVEKTVRKTSSLVKTVRWPAWGGAMELFFQIKFSKS